MKMINKYQQLFHLKIQQSNYGRKKLKLFFKLTTVIVQGMAF